MVFGNKKLFINKQLTIPNYTDMLKLISKLIGGNKSEKDVKQIEPLVIKINDFFQQCQSLSNDELRAKTVEFKQRIKEFLKEIDTEIENKKQAAEALPESDIQGRDTIYREVDELKKNRDKEIEKILNEILPQAFAVVKETAKRFKENAELVSTATDLDRDLSVKKDYIRIEDGKAVYKNSWMAAGNLITWNMVHYDVQLIGGIV